MPKYIVLQRVRKNATEDKYRVKYKTSTDGLDYTNTGRFSGEQLAGLDVSAQKLINESIMVAKNRTFIGYIHLVQDKKDAKWRFHGNSGFQKASIHTVFKPEYEANGNPKSVSVAQRKAQETAANLKQQLQHQPSVRTVRQQELDEKAAKRAATSGKYDFRAADNARTQSDDGELDSGRKPKESKKKKSKGKRGQASTSDDSAHNSSDMSRADGNSENPFAFVRSVATKARVPGTPHKATAVEGGTGSDDATTTPTTTGGDDTTGRIQDLSTIIAADGTATGKGRSVHVSGDMGPTAQKLSLGDALATHEEGNESASSTPNSSSVLSPAVTHHAALPKAIPMTFKCVSGEGDDYDDMDGSPEEVYILELPEATVATNTEDVTGATPTEKLVYLIEHGGQEGDAIYQKPLVTPPATTGGGSRVGPVITITLRCRTETEIAVANPTGPAAASAAGSAAADDILPDPTLDQMLAILHQRGGVLKGADLLSDALVKKVEAESAYTLLSRRGIRGDMQELFTSAERALIGLNEHKVAQYTTPQLPAVPPKFAAGGRVSEDEEEVVLSPEEEAAKAAENQWRNIDLPTTKYRQLTPIMPILVQLVLRPQDVQISVDDTRELLQVLETAMPTQENGFKFMRQLFRGSTGDYPYHDAMHALRQLGRSFVEGVYKAGQQDEGLLDRSTQRAESVMSGGKVKPTKAADVNGETEQKDADDADRDGSGEEVAEVEEAISFPTMPARYYQVFAWFVDLMIYKKQCFSDANEAWTEEQVAAYHAKHLKISIENFKQNFISMMKNVSDKVADAKKKEAEASEGDSATLTRLIQEAQIECETANQVIQEFLTQYFDFDTGQVTKLFNEHYQAAQTAERAAMEVDEAADEGKDHAEDHDSVTTGAGDQEVVDDAIQVGRHDGTLGDEEDAGDDDSAYADAQDGSQDEPAAESLSQQPLRLNLLDAMMFQDVQNQIFQRFYKRDFIAAQQQLETLYDDLKARLALYQWRYQQQHRGTKYEPIPATQRASRTRRASSAVTDEDFSETPSDSDQPEQRKPNLGQRLKRGFRNIFRSKGAKRASSSEGEQPKKKWMNRMYDFIAGLDEWTRQLNGLTESTDQNNKSTQPTIEVHLAAAKELAVDIKRLLSDTKSKADRYAQAQQKEQEARQRSVDKRNAKAKAEEEATNQLAKSTAAVHMSNDSITTAPTVVSMVSMDEASSQHMHFMILMLSKKNFAFEHAYYMFYSRDGKEYRKSDITLPQHVRKALKHKVIADWNKLGFGAAEAKARGAGFIFQGDFTTTSVELDVQEQQHVTRASLGQIWYMAQSSATFNTSNLNQPLVKQASAASSGMGEADDELSSIGTRDTIDTLDDDRHSAAASAVVTERYVTCHFQNMLCKKITMYNESGNPDYPDSVALAEKINSLNTFRSQCITAITMPGVKGWQSNFQLNIPLTTAQNGTDTVLEQALIEQLKRAIAAQANAPVAVPRRQQVNPEGRDDFSSSEEEEDEAQPTPCYLLQVVAPRVKEAGVHKQDAQLAVYQLMSDGSLKSITDVSACPTSLVERHTSWLEKGKREAYQVFASDNNSWSKLVNKQIDPKGFYELYTANLTIELRGTASAHQVGGLSSAASQQRVTGGNRSGHSSTAEAGADADAQRKDKHTYSHSASSR